MRTVALDNGLYRTDAENGITVVSEHIPSVRSVAIGVWIRTASANEDRAQMGVSHLLEHMVFKGTERRSAHDIALELEVRGGALDAFTSRDHTSYQARVLEEDLPRALDVLTDLVRHPLLRDADLDLERHVVLEEISTVEDTPEDLVFDLHAEALWPTHSYGFSILGTRQTVEDLGAVDLRALHGRAYHPRHIVITAAGKIDHEILLKLLARCGWFTDPAGPELTGVPELPAAKRTTRKVTRDAAQTQLVLGTDTVPYSDPRRYALILVNTVLGGGMSSRLFQRVREEQGLAYSVYSFHSFYRHGGVTGVYVGTHPAKAERALETIRHEMARLATEGLDAEALDEVKQQLRGQIVLSLEHTGTRMHRLAVFPLHDEPYRTIDQTLADIDAVTVDHVASVSAAFLTPERHTTVWLGPN